MKTTSLSASLLALLLTFLLTTSVSFSQNLHQQVGVATHFSRKIERFSHWDEEKIMPLIRDLGMGWIRDEVLWREVEPEKGKYQIPESTRKWIDLANKMGIKVIVCFNDNNPAYEDQYDPAAYAKAAAFLAKELKGKVPAIEIINEPFMYYAKHHNEGVLVGETWYGTKKDSKEDATWLWRYLTLLNQAADAIKAVNPQMKVIGLGNPAPANYKQIRKGVSKNVDGITGHPYSFRSTPEVLSYREDHKERDGFAVVDEDQTYASLVRRYHEFSKQHKGPRELWFTEWGFTNFRESKKEFIYSGFSETAQAKYSLRRTLETLALDVVVNIQYSMVDDYYPKQGWNEFEAEDNFGILRHDLTPKPVYFALQRLLKETLDYKPRRDLSSRVYPYSDRSESKPRVWDGQPLPAPDRIAKYHFSDKNNHPVIALWSMERVNDLNPRAADLEINLDSSAYRVEILDLMTGKTSSPKIIAKNNKTFALQTLAVPDYPILVKLFPKK